MADRKVSPHVIKDILRRAFSHMPYSFTHHNAHFDAYLKLLQTLDALSTEEIRAWQFKQLQGLIHVAYEETDFYREHYRRAGIQPADIRDLADVAALPVVTKDDVREQGLRMIRRTVPLARVSKVTTSGSTGAPLTLYVSAATAARERAAICHQWARVGYHDGAGRVEFRGIVGGNQLCEHFPADRMLRINVNRLDAADIPEIIRVVNACPYPFLHGYPHALERFALLLEQLDLGGALHAPQALLLASELVLDTQVALLKRVFPASRIFAHYGLAERVALGGWMADGHEYHFLPGYAWVEADELGRLIGTSLTNDVMPLIRYGTTDVLGGFQAGPAAYPHLFPVAQRIEGRQHDNLQTSTGGFVSPGLLYHALKDGTSFLACRIIQHTRQRLELMVETQRPEPEVRAEFVRISANLRQVFGQDVAIDLVLTERIPRLPCGKFKWVETRLHD
jgi:phenylacetate-CoA ligase